MGSSLFNRENLLADCLQGCFVVTCTLCAFISLVWLREQIVHGGAPQWLEQNQQQAINGIGQQNEVILNISLINYSLQLETCSVAVSFFIPFRLRSGAAY